MVSDIFAKNLSHGLFKSMAHNFMDTMINIIAQHHASLLKDAAKTKNKHENYHIN